MKPQDELVLHLLAAMETKQAEAKKAPKIGPEHIFTQDGKIPNAVKGYVASFGATVVQLGIMPACMAYMVDDKKKYIASLMFNTYKAICEPAAKGDMDEYFKKEDKWKNLKLESRNRFRSDMTSIAVSLKMAMRSFEFDTSTEE